MNPLPATAAAAASPLSERFSAVRARSLELIRTLSAEDCQAQSMPDASPAKWHLAHTTWFFETFILERFEPNFAPFDPSFRVLFNSYYNGVGEQHPRPARGLLTRPSLDVVRRWREATDARIARLLEQRGGGAPEIGTLAELGLHHEQQHQELLLTDLKHLLSQHPGRPLYRDRWPMVSVQPQPLSWFAHDGGLVEIGHDPSRDGAFCFDNEAPQHRVFVAPFEIASRPVTHGEIIGFIDDGGYRRPELWLAAGWDWLRAGAREAPLYWQREADDDWRTFTLHGMAPIDAHTPAVHLSYFEADAYARWAGTRLPTEAEWEHVARRLPAINGNFADRGALHPLPSAQAPTTHPVQMFGDVWEWTSSDYAPYAGYRPAEGAVGEYNGKFMSGQYVLRGGSCATPAGHARASYRNFFPPSAQWQFSGLRLARDRAR